MIEKQLFDIATVLKTTIWFLIFHIFNTCSISVTGLQKLFPPLIQSSYAVFGMLVFIIRIIWILSNI